jgi:hypothetical protein
MQFLDLILMTCVAISLLIALYITVVRVTTGHKYKSYDCWILALFIAIALQMYDNHFP